MLEIERKILGINRRAVESAIKKLRPGRAAAMMPQHQFACIGDRLSHYCPDVMSGHPSTPRKIFDGLVRVKYFDFPDGEIRAKKDLLRLREFVPQKGKPYTELVYKIYKGVKHGCKYFEEIEFVLPESLSFKLFGDFLKKLGLVQTLYYEKKRTLYRFGAIKFEIDEHPRMPPFLEIEAPSPREIDRMITRLGLDKHEQTAESIGELLRRKYPNLRLNNLVFRACHKIN